VCVCVVGGGGRGEGVLAYVACVADACSGIDGVVLTVCAARSCVNSLSKNSIGDEGAKALADGLKANTSLTYLK